MGMLRFYLALCVVAFHARATGAPFVPPEWAVRSFFVISGFYMSLALTTKYSDALTFWANRALRLYPAFLFVVLAYWAWYFFTWAWLHKPPSGSHIWEAAYSSMQWWQRMAIVFSNWTMIGQDLLILTDYSPLTGFSLAKSQGETWGWNLMTNGPAWSLGVELWFYLLAPILVKARSSLLVALGALSGALFLITPYMIPIYSFPTNLCFFVAGMLVQRHSIAATTFLKRSSALHFDNFLGNLSYPIYVSHMLVILVTGNVLHATKFLIVGPVTVAFSCGLYMLLERPIDRWRNAKARSPAGKHSKVCNI